MGVKFANNVSTTIRFPVASNDTTITVAAGYGSLFPVLASGDYFFATLIAVSGVSEIVRCTARVGDVLTVVRGQDGTLATGFPADSRIEMRVNAAALQALVEDTSYLVL